MDKVGLGGPHNHAQRGQGHVKGTGEGPGPDPDVPSSPGQSHKDQLVCEHPSMTTEGGTPFSARTMGRPHLWVSQQE